MCCQQADMFGTNVSFFDNKKVSAASLLSRKQCFEVPMHTQMSPNKWILIVIPYWYYEYQFYCLPIDCLLIVYKCMCGRVGPIWASSSFGAELSERRGGKTQTCKPHVKDAAGFLSNRFRDLVSGPSRCDAKCPRRVCNCVDVVTVATEDALKPSKPIPNVAKGSL